jgi:hypothetical protein
MKRKLVPIEFISRRIFELRGQKVILDADIAELYGVSVKRLNEQVKRNIERFPEDFMFQLKEEEGNSLRSQFATLKRGQHNKYLPYAFTRNGVNMLATVLRSKIAVQRSIFIMRAFSALEEAISHKKRELLSSPDAIRELSVHSRAIMRLFQEVKLNRKQMGNIERLQKDMTKLIQKIILASIA